MFVFAARKAQTVCAMTVVVQKYGGTSVADTSRIEEVADRVVSTRDAGHQVVVVVSAMGQTTDTLLELASEISPSPHPREMDMLLTAGERISMALLAMALHDRDVPAVSFTGSQAGILTDASHGAARITRVTGERVRDALADDKVVIVAGFQGVDPQSREVTTLGRGGSDTTAVALAAALEAETCEILTDVEGVFTADPRLVPSARKIAEIEYDQMTAMARAGAGVLMPDSVEFAAENDVVVHVRSSFTDAAGTQMHRSAQKLGFAGLAMTHEEDHDAITVVGTDARDQANHLMVEMDQNGIVSAVVYSDDHCVTFSVEPDESVKTLNFLHGRLEERQL